MVGLYMCACAHERTRKKTLTKQQKKKENKKKKAIYKLQAKWSSSTDRATDNERGGKRWYIYAGSFDKKRTRKKGKEGKTKKKKKKAVPILPPSRE